MVGSKYYYYMDVYSNVQIENNKLIYFILFIWSGSKFNVIFALDL